MQSPRLAIAPNGPELSRVVLGLWRLNSWDLTPLERQAFLEQAIEMGITTTDHADIYGDYEGEALFGEILAGKPSLRDRIEIVTKCGIKLVSKNRPDHRLQHYDTTRGHIVASVENSLAQMRTDRIDLLLIHRPDPLMDADELAETFTALRDAGKVRHFGVSNFTPAQFDLLASRFPLVTNQVELSPLHLAPLHDGTLDQCQRLRVSPMIWSALAGGRLFAEHTPQAERVRKLLLELATEYDTSPTAIVYAWVMMHPSKPLVLTGSRRILAARDAVKAAHLRLTREQWFAIWSASTGTSVP